MFRFFSGFWSVIGLLLIVTTVVALGFYFFYNSDNTFKSHVDFQSESNLYAGAPFDLVVNINNDSGNTWQNVKLSLSLPEGVVFFGNSPDKAFEVKNFGNLGSGSLTQVTYKLMAAKQGKIEALLSYMPEGVGSRFQEKQMWEIPSVQVPVSLTIEAPKEVVNGAKISFKINYQNTGDVDLENLYLEVSYPKDFSYEKSSIEPDLKKNVWNLDSLRKGSSGNLSIFGKLLGNTTGTLDFVASISKESQSAKYLLAQAKVSISTKESPLYIGIDLNETGGDYVAKPGDTLNYGIGYSQKADIKVKLIGSVFDLSTIQVYDGGFIQPGSNQIVWKNSNLDEDGGSVTFSIKVKNDYGIKRLGDRNFVLKIEAEANSKEYSNKAELETKVAGQVKVESKGYFRDADSGVVNSGPMPPKSGASTNYTVHWLVFNYANDIKDIVIKAQLPTGVTFISNIKSNIDSKPAFNLSSNEVIWRINRIGATTGVIGKPLEAVFQIQAIPSGSNVGQYMTLLGETKITANDEFTNAELFNIAPAITTALPDDASVGTSGIVSF